MALLFAMAPFPSGAQAPADGASGSAAIEEIIVSSQKRSERVQDVPIAITTFGAEDIERSGYTALDQISAQTPGLFMEKFNVTRPQTYIRGVGTRVFDAGSEGSVGVFVDEVYLGRLSGSLSDLLDVERIEVLKGPQGTLYGRNTIG
ncbi:MAG: Plug domain-containing protein, partial [Alphaproteobacteria bacterium]